MVKTIAFVAVVVNSVFGFTNAALTSTSVNESCSLVDFTTQETQFLLLNNAVDVATQSTLLSTFVKNYDPLVLQNIGLGEFSYSILGQDLTFVPTLDRLNVTGLANIIPQHINTSSSNCVDFGADCTGEVSIEATVSLTLEEIDTSISADVSLTLDKPTLIANVQADMFGCASGATDCEDFTVTTIEVAGVDGKYNVIMDSLLLRFKSAVVQTVTLDFDSIVNSGFSFHSSGPIISAITDVLADFSADEINKKGDTYDKFTSNINDQLLSVANDYIDSKLKPKFGATCIEA
ncbi:Serine/threonine protein Kinase [Phytophthora palmivora]|uniref:Serine/threonine protein Kinase n=1 Tax=Phytophthora palmivora TaxID=4796 RepID=A0A2P4X6W9_9STRA|nr:Serine/threonine protein Kinase [Phytophthora palmivora]